MEQTNLVKILHGDIGLTNKVNVRDVALFDMHVIIYPKDVRAMLRKFLANQISADDLNRWAEFICLRAEYSNPNWKDENEETMDYYEDMRYVIQCLSTPEIDGDITVTQVKQYLSELEKYDHDPYPISMWQKK